MSRAGEVQHSGLRAEHTPEGRRVSRKLGKREENNAGLSFSSLHTPHLHDSESSESPCCAMAHSRAKISRPPLFEQSTRLRQTPVPSLHVIYTPDRYGCKCQTHWEGARPESVGPFSSQPAAAASSCTSDCTITAVWALCKGLQQDQAWRYTTCSRCRWNATALRPPLLAPSAASAASPADRRQRPRSDLERRNMSFVLRSLYRICDPPCGARHRPACLATRHPLP